MMTARFNLPEFDRQLLAISDALKRRAVRSATGAAASVFREAAFREAPVSKRWHRLKGGRVVMPGYLKQNVYQWRAKAQPGIERFKVSVRGGRTGRTLKTGQVRDAYYWRWVHEGHASGKRLPGGVRRKALERKRRAAAGKHVQGNPFLARAFSSSTQRALNAFSAKLDSAVAKYNR